jgi:hypothetical protein
VCGDASVRQAGPRAIAAASRRASVRTPLKYAFSSAANAEQDRKFSHRLSLKWLMLL